MINKNYNNIDNNNLCESELVKHIKIALSQKAITNIEITPIIIIGSNTRKSKIIISIESDTNYDEFIGV